MSWWNRVKAALGREAAEAKDLYRDAEARLEGDLARREADLQATPEEKLARMTDELQTGEDPFDEVRARIDKMRSEGPDAEPPSPPGGAGS